MNGPTTQKRNLKRKMGEIMPWDEFIKFCDEHDISSEIMMKMAVGMVKFRTVKGGRPRLVQPCIDKIRERPEDRKQLLAAAKETMALSTYYKLKMKLKELNL